MKKIITILAAIALMSMAPATERSYTLTESQAVLSYQLLIRFEQIIPESEVISAKEANMLLHGIDSMKKVIDAQYMHYHAKDTAAKK